MDLEEIISLGAKEIDNALKKTYPYDEDEINRKKVFEKCLEDFKLQISQARPYLEKKGANEQINIFRDFEISHLMHVGVAQHLILENGKYRTTGGGAISNEMRDYFIKNALSDDIFSDLNKHEAILVTFNIKLGSIWTFRKILHKLKDVNIDKRSSCLEIIFNCIGLNLITDVHNGAFNKLMIDECVAQNLDLKIFNMARLEADFLPVTAYLGPIANEKNVQELINKITLCEDGDIDYDGYLNKFKKIANTKQKSFLRKFFD